MFFHTLLQKLLWMPGRLLPMGLAAGNWATEGLWRLPWFCHLTPDLTSGFL